MGRRKTEEEFIVDAWCKHGDKYNYKLVDYIHSKVKIKIICSVHGVFDQIPNSHLRGFGCSDCKRVNHIKNITHDKDTFINQSIIKHNGKYDYSLVEYKGCRNKVSIICPVHGVFEQVPHYHTQGNGCQICSGKGLDGYTSYDTYQSQLQPYGVDCRRSPDDENVLEVKCVYCGKWHKPERGRVFDRVRSINGGFAGDNHMYCSNGCKDSCPIFNRSRYPKGHGKQGTSREVQPQLRKLVLERDNWTCQKCENDDELHCHHYEGVEINPIESADVDNCITLCRKCHNETHQQDGCRMVDFKRKKCK